MSVKVDIDLSQLEKLTADLEKAAPHEVTIGIEDKQGPSGVSTVKYGNFFEFGWVQRTTGKQAAYLSTATGKNIVPNSTLASPPRPFFRGTVEAEGHKWVKHLKKAIQHYSIDNILTAHQQALELVGMEAVDDIRNTLSSGGTRNLKFPPRSPLTMALYQAIAAGHQKDGSGNYSTMQPGVVTGTLLKAIAFQVS